MRKIRDKILFLLCIELKLPYFFFHRIRHLIKTMAQDANFISSCDNGPLLVAAVCDAARRADQAQYRLHKQSSEGQRDESANT